MACVQRQRGEEFNVGECLSLYGQTQLQDLWDYLHLKCSAALLDYTNAVVEGTDSTVSISGLH